MNTLPQVSSHSPVGSGRSHMAYVSVESMLAQLLRQNEELKALVLAQRAPSVYVCAPLYW